MLFRSRVDGITSGKLFPAVIQFAIPLFISTLVQALFSAADTAVVGNFTAGDGNAVASIGAANPVISLLINGFIALSTGASIIIARAVGAGDRVVLKKAVDTAIIFSFSFGVLLTVAALVFAVPVLRAMDCPESCFNSAVLYMRIYMLGTPAVMVYNFAGAIIRAEGDSTRPLLYIIISGIVNVVTNVVLCLLLEDKIIAVAVATVLSQIVSAVLVMARLICNTCSPCHFSLRNFGFDWKALGSILRYGIPLSIASAIFPIANLQIQPAINSYGPANLAGNTASCNIDNLTSALYIAFNSACLTFMSQNIGAHNSKRVVKTFYLCTICAVLSGLICGVVTCCYSEELINLFIPGNAEAVYYGQKRMQYVTAFMWLAALNGSLSSAVQSFGYPTMSTLNNVISVLVFRIIWMNFVYNRAPSIDRLYVCYTISWSIIGVVYVIMFVYAFTKYRRSELQRQQEPLQSP